jgi:hypothetical protein
VRSRGPARCVAVLAVLAALASVGSISAVPAGAAEEYTPAIVMVLSAPCWVRGADGRVHLTYELEVTNAFPISVTVTGIDVLETRDDRSIASLSGDELTASMSLLTSPTEPTTALEPATIGVVWFDIPLDAPRDVPAAIDHRVTIRVPPGYPVPETIVATGGAAKVDRRAPIMVGPPLVGAGWLALGSCCDGPHRRSVQPLNGKLYLGQRFAIDFNRLDSRDFLATGDQSLNTSYPTYGQPVLAVADAKVAAAVDRFADQMPNAGKPVTLEEADGNHVILDLGNGRFAFYAHLKPGTVAVKRGDKVQTGQIIAMTGNSGSSSGPHLHFQVMDRPSALVSNGLPYVFDRFVLDGTSPPLDELLTIDPEKTPIPIDRTDTGPRRNELPLGRDLVTFAEARE